MQSQFEHISVMPTEIISTAPRLVDDGYLVIDCTTGGGGHLDLLINNLECSKTKFIGIDQDKDALLHLRSKFSERILTGSVIIEESDFGSIADVCAKNNVVGKVDYIYADLGVSSHQLDTGARGFSIHTEAELDMRMNTSQDLTAKDIINHWTEEDIANTIYKYGDEPMSRRIARAIVARRESSPINTTTELAEIVKSACHYKTHSKRHPAIKTFQAIRIAVNDELGQLEKLLNDGFEMLKPGGRMAIITFHSLEDRLVKQKFKALSGRLKKDNTPFRHLPMAPDEPEKVFAKIVKPFPMLPSKEEVAKNRRSRSAKLRGIEKLN